MGATGAAGYRRYLRRSHEHFEKRPRGRTDTAMTYKYPPPMVTITRYQGSRICDVVVAVRGQELVVRCPTYSQALEWARLECKSYKIPEPTADFPDNEEPDDVPLFLRPDRN
jgi:hypothetical protein